MVNNVVNFFNKIFGAFGVVADFITDMLIDSVNSVINLISGALNLLGDGISTLAGFLLDLFSKLASALETLVVFVVGVILDIVKSLTYPLEELVDFLKDAVSSIWNGLTTTIGNLIDSWMTAIKDNWYCVATIDPQKVITFFVDLYLDLGLDGVTTLGGIKLGEALYTLIASLSVSPFSIYIPHILNPVLFTDTGIVEGDGVYRLTDAIKDVVVLLLMGTVIKMGVKNGIKIVSKLVGIVSNYRKAAIERARWNQMFEYQYDTLMKVIQTQSTIGLRLSL
jgi:Flp pilus assembly pilin Flp